MAAFPLEREIEYPTSDGEPMGETPHHRLVMTDLIQGFESLYAGDPDAWVGGNCFFCYREGDPEAAVAPDLLVVKGVPKISDRRNYLLWAEGRVPTLIAEVTSRKTRRQDVEKRDLYEWLGVEEYFRFDPFGEYLKPKLQGFRLENGAYRPLAAGLGGALESRATGVTWRPEGDRVRFIVTATGERLLWHEEQVAARKAAEARAVEAEARVQALEAELERLRRKLSEP